MALRVTYIIAHHNYQEHLPKAIESAKKQKYKCNICVIDDCSENPKETQKMIQDNLFDGNWNETQHGNDVTIQDKEINGSKRTLILLQGKARGPSYARNMGIRQTINDTDVFAILDADDTNDPYKVEKMVNVFNRFGEYVGVVYADYNTINEHGKITREYKKPYDYFKLRQDCMVHSGSLVRSEVFKAVGLYDEEMRTCEDYDLWMRASKKFIFYHLPEALSLVLVHDNNSTNTVQKEIWVKNWQRVHLKDRQNDNI